MNEAEARKALVETLDRIAMVLGALFASHLGDVGQDLKIERLSRCGFTNVQIASILGTTSNAVNVGLHRARRGRAKPRRRRSTTKGRR